MMELAVRAFEVLLGWSLLLQTLEYLRLIGLDRVSHWPVQRSELPHRPAWLRPLNPDTIVPHLVRAEGLPVDFLREPEEMEALAQQDQAAQQAMAAQAASESVRNLGGVDETAKAAALLQAS
jgi:hypothetical protein